MNVTYLHAPEITASRKYEFHQKIIRSWMGSLSEAQFKVLMFIYDRTWGWNKQMEYIKTEHFCTGVQGHFCGTGMGRSAVFRALQDLRKVDIIRSHTDGRGTYFSINERWEPRMLREPKGGKNRVKSGLKEPQKLTKKSRKRDTRSAVNATPIYKKEHDKKEHEHRAASAALCSTEGDTEEETYRAGNFIKSQAAPGAPIPSAAGEVTAYSHLVKDAIQKSAAARDKAMARAMKSQSIPALEKMWQAAVRKEFPEASLVAWSRVARGKVIGFKKQWESQAIYRKDKGMKVWDFFHFAIANWRRVRQIKLNWMKDVLAPEYPDVEFLIGFKKHFITAMDEEGFEKRRMKLTARDRLYQKLIREGYTPEEAEREAEQDDKAAKAIQREQEITKRAHSDARALKQQLAAAEKENQRLLLAKDAAEQRAAKAHRRTGRDRLKPAEAPAKPKGLVLVEGAFGKWKDDDFE